MNRKEKNHPLGTFFVMILITGVTAFGFVTIKRVTDKPKAPVEKMYPVSQTLKFWQVTVDCLKQSQAPSATTNALIEEISKQIDPILQSEARVQDSLNKLKPKPKQ